MAAVSKLLVAEYIAIINNKKEPMDGNEENGFVDCGLASPQFRVHSLALLQRIVENNWF